MRRDFRIAGGTIALAYVLGVGPALGQGPTIDTGGGANSPPGANSSRLGPAPGAGMSGFEDAPGSGSALLGGRPGASVGRTPASSTMPGGAMNAGTTAGIRPIAALPAAELPNYGPLSVPAGGDDEGPADGLALNDLIERLIRYNIDLRSKSYEIPQAQADVLTASLRANPVLYADSQLIPFGQYSRSRPGGPTQYDLNITFPIDINRKRAARVAVASQAKRVIEALYQDAVRQQIDNLYTAYVDVLNTRLTVDYAKASVSGLESTLKTTLDKRKQGAVTDADVGRVKIPRDLAAIALDDAEAQYRRTLRTLGTLLNVPPGEAESLKIRGSVRDPDPQALSADNLTRMALAVRPDVIANRIGIGRAQADVTLAERNKFGDVYLLVQPYTFQDNAPYGTKSATSYAVGLTVPLPIVNRNQGNIARARLNVDQTRLDLLNVERQVVTEVQQAVAEYEVSLQAVRRAESSLREAEQVLKSVESLWLGGEYNVLTYLNARREYNDTVRQYRDFMVRHRRSMLDVNTAVGQRLLP